ncbi:heme oxygenase (biliverdin-producing) [filamentous cyanobacterium LEGE 11480]|uniref:heme oxygenase (biliverdin-producing) n=1 Tax=Romeriopsis navalis LEGE 11480 TaxID=2777977 RepID=A0A928Z738_9CYAN|nr:heme oxygenase (biliverdin-producing) [Romeriopsis navalis]MBE9032825.1 heme oxygenase (biliverdin-producing) [Romeriopsis navalis LEGE 11480]
MSSNLALKLREGTKKAHTMAENTGFIACFLRGTVEKNSYRKLVANLYFVYAAMEEAMHNLKDHPVMGKMYFPELDRKESLEQDLAYYYGANWREEVQPSAATQAYVAQINKVAQEDPEKLIAHLYTRYIGDLSGGQILKKIAVNAMGLNEGEGTNFYAFPKIADEKEFKTMYRGTLDSLPVSEEKGDAIVEEANDAFHHNMNMFQELEGNLIKAIGVQLFSLLTRRRSRGSTEAVAQS